MTPTELKRLEEIAKKATPGPWINDTSRFVDSNRFSNSDGIGVRFERVYRQPDKFTQENICETLTNKKQNSEFIAAFSPDVCLELIQMIIQEQEQSERLARQIEDLTELLVNK